MFSSLPGQEKLVRIEGFYRRMRAVSPRDQQRAARGGASRYFFEWAEVYAARGETQMARRTTADVVGDLLQRVRVPSPTR